MSSTEHNTCLELLKKARDMNIVDSGSSLIFDSFIKECDLKIKKNNDQMAALLGANKELSLMRSMLSGHIRKLMVLQEQADVRERENRERIEALAEEKDKESDVSGELKPQPKKKVTSKPSRSKSGNGKK